MNVRYSAPEIIGTHRIVNQDGDDTHRADYVVGVAVTEKDGKSALVQLDIRQYRGNKNLVLEFELHELVSAISLATLRSSE